METEGIEREDRDANKRQITGMSNVRHITSHDTHPPTKVSPLFLSHTLSLSLTSLVGGPVNVHGLQCLQCVLRPLSGETGHHNVLLGLLEGLSDLLGALCVCDTLCGHVHVNQLDPQRERG